MCKYTVLILLFVLHFTIQQDTNFCDSRYVCFKSGNPTQHTICQLNHECGVSKNCIKFESCPLTEKEKQALVDKHNELRNWQALGNGSKSKDNENYPTAADMRELVWDKDLEFQAQCWANQCPINHDPCRTKSDKKTSGQNLAWSSKNEILVMTQRFYEECQNTSISIVDKHYKPQSGEPMIGHFTQLVWGNTSEIGCGRSRYYYPKAKRMTYFLACNYASAGNWEGMPLYQKGEPCSKCPEGSKCHKKYTGLCTTKLSESKTPNICKYSPDPKNCKPILPEPKPIKHEKDVRKKPKRKQKGSTTKKLRGENTETTNKPKAFYTKSIGPSKNMKTTPRQTDEVRNTKGGDGKAENCVLQRKIIIINSSTGYRKKLKHNLLIILYLLYHTRCNNFVSSQKRNTTPKRANKKQTLVATTSPRAGSN